MRDSLGCLWDYLGNAQAGHVELCPSKYLAVPCALTNNFRNSTGMTFCRIPKKESVRREYVRLLRNGNLKLHSQSCFRSVGHLFALCSFGCSLFYRLFGFTECKPQPHRVQWLCTRALKLCYSLQNNNMK